MPHALPIAEVPGVDLRMLAAAALLTGLTGVGFGVVPALRACRQSGEDALREGSRAGAGRDIERLRSVLVIAEVAAAVVLVVSTGLLLRALWQVRDRGARRPAAAGLGRAPARRRVDAETVPRRVQGSVLGAFAAIAFLLAAVGIHGLLAFSVATRTREIGVRVALGARAPEILGMVLRRTLLLAAAGVALGAGLAYAAGRTLQALLAEVSPTDRTTFAATVVLVLLMTIAGCLQPAARALRVDPLSAIRAEP